MESYELPTFHYLDKGYIFYPRIGKQVCGNKILIPLPIKIIFASQK